VNLLKLALFAALALTSVAVVSAQDQKDIDAINKMLDQYRDTEASGDKVAQATLMTPDRVWVSNDEGRRVDNVDHMRLQQIDAENFKQLYPGRKHVVEDRYRLVKFHGEGKIAVATFFRHSYTLFPPGTPYEEIKDAKPYITWIMLVLEKQKDGKWLIVATHV